MYSGSSQALQFFGLRENPFRFPSSSALPLVTGRIQCILDELASGVQARKGLLVLTGEVGTGKTTLARRLAVWLEQQKIRTAFVFNSHLEPSELFAWMLDGFGVYRGKNQPGSVQQCLRGWLQEQHCSGGRAMLIIDEAQGLPLAMFEEVRLLLNEEIAGERVLQILLCGQPELTDILKRPELRQIRQRVEVWCHTAPLDRAEARAYLQRRLEMAGMKGQSVFLPEAADAIQFYAGGIPRVMNLLSEHALLRAGTRELRHVTEDVVDEVARELQYDERKPVAGLRNAGNAGLATSVRSRPSHAGDAETLPTAHQVAAPHVEQSCATPGRTESGTVWEEPGLVPVDPRREQARRVWMHETPTLEERLSAFGRRFRLSMAGASRVLTAVCSPLRAASGRLFSALGVVVSDVFEWMGGQYFSRQPRRSHGSPIEPLSQQSIRLPTASGSADLPNNHRGS